MLLSQLLSLARLYAAAILPIQDRSRTRPTGLNGILKLTGGIDYEATVISMFFPVACEQELTN